MESAIRGAGGTTNFVATITYPNDNTQIPSKYKYEYILQGNKFIDEFKNDTPDEVVVNNNLNNNGQQSISSIDKNGNGIVTIAEAKAAGFIMPITADHWLYPYMIDRDGDGMVGEAS